MEKRKIIFGTYDTALQGAWTLARLNLTSPAFQTNLVQVPGRSRPLDLSAVLTDGEPVYNSRNLTAVLENSDDDRAARERRIRDIIAELDGYQKQIWLPDDAEHYLQGRLHVVRDYNDLAHASVTVTAVCDPWLYNNEETVHNLAAKAQAQTAIIVNYGRRAVVPVLEITGGSVSLIYGTYTWSLSTGTYQLPDFILRTGEHQLTYSGTGSIKITYREAVLL